MPFDDPEAPADPVARADACAAALWRDAARFDDPSADLDALLAPVARAGLFRACLPVESGGEGLATEPSQVANLAGVLRRIGGANLSAGRLFEGHANACKLVFRFGDTVAQAAFAADVAAGARSGVWNAAIPPGLTLAGDILSGAKIYCSGAGVLERPLVTAQVEGGALQMLLLRRGRDLAHDLSAWRPAGMRATATGTVRFDGARIGGDQRIGALGDYYSAPAFKGGAWRFCAVQLGAMERLLSLFGEHLDARGRAADPHQRARFGHASVAVETARLWVDAAAMRVEGGASHPADAEAYAGLARTAVERAALDLLEQVERGVGLEARMQPNPIERVARDLATYLRQPFPDGVLDEAATRRLSHPAPLHGDRA